MFYVLPVTLHVPLDERKPPLKLNLRNRSKDLPDKLYQRLLPFYMKPIVLIAFMGISLVGQISWALAMALLESVDLQWNSTVGFVLGIILGYTHGKWTARMWERDYLRVLRREIRFWQTKGGKGTTIYVMLALGVPIFWSVFIAQSYHGLAGVQSYIFGFIGGMNLALYLWVRRLPK